MKGLILRAPAADSGPEHRCIRYSVDEDMEGSEIGCLGGACRASMLEGLGRAASTAPSFFWEANLKQREFGRG